MNQTVDLSIIILNYNAGKFLQQCLDSLFENCPPFPWEIIIVDNNSTDGSRNMLARLAKYAPLRAERNKGEINRNMPRRGGAKQIEINRNRLAERAKQREINRPEVRVIFNDQNLGFAVGNNRGITVSKGRYLLFLNPDTIVFPGVIETVFNFMEKNPRVGAATCRLELANGELDEACHRGFPTPWRAFCHFFGLEKLFPRNRYFAGYTLGHLLEQKTPHEIDACSGAFMMVKKEVGDQVGWWDEDYFWYGEDIDFCYRIKQAGYQIYFLPQVKIIHYRGVSSGIKKHSQKISQASLATRIKAAKASTEAMRIFYRKHYLSRYPRAITALVFFAIAMLKIIRTLRIIRIKLRDG